MTREIDLIEKRILADIDLNRGPDESQINLAVNLNIFKMFSLEGDDQPRLIQEMVQCFNIVLLRDDSRRAFEPVFDRAIECIQSYTSAVDNHRRISLICQCINGLDVPHWTPKPLRHATVLLDCLRDQPENARLIRFAANYLPRDSRLEFLNMICQKSIADPAILTIIIEEIQANRSVHDGKFLDLVLDHLKELNEALPPGIECIMELIDRAKKVANTDWKSLLRLIKTDYPRVQTRILVAKLIGRTIGALRSTDRADAIQHLLPKSDHGLLTFAHVANDLLVGKENIDTELFSDYPRRTRSCCSCFVSSANRIPTRRTESCNSCKSPGKLKTTYRERKRINCCYSFSYSQTPSLSSNPSMNHSFNEAQRTFKHRMTLIETSTTGW